ncbi:MAG: hypothetical protein IJQ66_05620, partial [Clostridia bacterium]|nr:hypothetical protein [Clostridia bacterium]
VEPIEPEDPVEPEEPFDTIWIAGVNTTVSGIKDGEQEVTRVTTTDAYKDKGGYIYIPAEKLSGKTTVTFDLMIKSFKDLDGNDVSSPKIIYYQDIPVDGTNYGAFWDNSKRLTDRNGYTGYETIVKLSDDTPVA